MTNSEIVSKYLKSIGFKMVQDGGTLEPILPFIQMDVAYNMWLKEVSPIPCKNELKKLKREWIHRYCLFNRAFFNVYTQEEQFEIIDIMDEFESHINKDLENIKSSVIDFLSDLPSDISSNCASLILINILCQSAQEVWKQVYKSNRFKDLENKEIAFMEKISSRFMKSYHDCFCKRYVDPNHSKEIEKAVDGLDESMTEWLKRSNKKWTSHQ